MVVVETVCDVEVEMSAAIIVLVIEVVLVEEQISPTVEVLTDVVVVVVVTVVWYASTWRFAVTKICPSAALRELKCVGSEPIVA